MLVLTYRYVQSSVDTSLYHNDAEFASPGFMLAGDDLPKPPPPPTAKPQQTGALSNTHCMVHISVENTDLDLCQQPTF